MANIVSIDGNPIVLGTSGIEDGSVTLAKLNSGVIESLPQPTDAQVDSAVSDWLDLHPEATTTVQDGAITTAKLADGAVTDAKLAQTGGVLERVEAIEDVLPKATETVTRITADSGATWESGAFYYSSNGAVGGTLMHNNYAALSCAVYGSVHAGDVFNITARSAGSGYAIIIANNSDVVLAQFVSPTSNNYYDEATYTVPYDGTMYLNTYTADYLEGQKKYVLTQNVTSLTPIKSSLDGVKWASIGDSIVAFNQTAETNWVKYMIAGTAVNNTNLAFSGSGFYRYSELDGYTQNNYISKIASIPSDVELITIAGSFNDLATSPWPSLPVGTSSDSGSTTIAGYMNAFFDALLAAFPDVPIAVVMTSPWDAYKPGVTASDSYVEVLGEICQKNGIPFCPDCYFGCNLKPWIAANKTEYYTHPDSSIDGVHPNSDGHVFIYRMLRPFLERVAHTTV